MHRRIIIPSPGFVFSAKRKKQGFALVLALGLMAFLLLLLLALSTLSRVETGINEARLQSVTARQNAMLGLRVALGELQKLAGPDQIATARADLLGDGLENSYWTGVWSGVETNGNPVPSC